MSKKNASIEVVASDFTRAMREMSRMTGVSFQDIIRAETKSILEAAARKTVSAQAKLIEARINEKWAWTLKPSFKTYIVNPTPKYPRGWRIPDGIWNDLKAARRASIKKRKDARGLSKKSWMQVAEKLGMQISVPGYVAKATTSRGDYPNNTSATEIIQGRNFFIQLMNQRTYSWSVLDAIRAAIRGRTNFFKKNMRLGVFQKTSEIAAKYPGLKVAA